MSAETNQPEDTGHADTAGDATGDANRTVDAATGTTPDASDTDLSPAVRRLVKQYELDVTGIRGSGPDGRIRVSDVMATLGSRTGAPVNNGDSNGDGDAEDTALSSRQGGMAATAAVRPQSVTGTRPFCTLNAECEIGAVVAYANAHYSAAPQAGVLGCVLSACATAAQAVPEINTGARVLIAEITWPDANGDEIRRVADTAQSGLSEELTVAWLASGGSTAGGLPPRRGHRATTFTVHWLGAGGATTASALPVTDSHAASLGVTRPQSQVVVQRTEGQESARIRQMISLVLTFDTTAVSLHRANHFLADMISRLGTWQPDAGTDSDPPAG